LWSGMRGVGGRFMEEVAANKALRKD
jgi:hypothetical protein